MRRWTATLACVVVLALLTDVVTAQPPSAPKRRPGEGGFRPPMPPVMEAIDADKDGVLSQAEIAGAAEALKKLDRNGDGQLSREEMGFGRGRFGGFGPGRPGMGGPRRPGPGPSGGRDTGASAFQRDPIPKNDAEKKILDVLDDINRGRRMMNVPKEDGRLLRLLAETIGAKHVVEIGTSNGCSALWFCLALRTTGGKLTTHEINADRAALARENFKRAGVGNIVTLVEGDAHEEVTKIKEPIDLLFLDADKQGYIDYFNKLLPLVRPGGLVAAHNISPRMADPKYVEAITASPDLETIFLHMQGAGVSVSMKKR